MVYPIFIKINPLFCTNAGVLFTRQSICNALRFSPSGITRWSFRVNAQGTLPKEAAFQEGLVDYRALLDLCAMEGRVEIECWTVRAFINLSLALGSKDERLFEAKIMTSMSTNASSNQHLYNLIWLVDQQHWDELLGCWKSQAQSQSNWIGTGI